MQTETIDIMYSDVYSDIHEDNFVWALVGKIGSGLTTTAIQMARDWKKPTPLSPVQNIIGRVVAFDPTGILKKACIVDYEILESHKDWAKTLIEKDRKGNYKFANSLLILDDYRLLISGQSTPADFLNLLTHKRRIGLSIIYMAHSPRLILERISFYTTHYSVFDLNENIQDKNFMYKNLQIAKDLIKEHITLNGKGTYPNFPHIIVKAGTEEYELRNK